MFLMRYSVVLILSYAPARGMHVMMMMTMMMMVIIVIAQWWWHQLRNKPWKEKLTTIDRPIVQSRHGTAV